MARLLALAVSGRRYSAWKGHQSIDEGTQTASQLRMQSPVSTYTPRFADLQTQISMPASPSGSAYWLGSVPSVRESAVYQSRPPTPQLFGLAIPIGRRLFAKRAI